MSQIPHDKNLDSTLALMSEGYMFISRRCQRYRSDLFETRLMLRKAVCMMGEEAARIFYHPGRFTRKGALPITTRKLLQDEGSVQLMDGEAHRRRKRMFMSLMTPERIKQLADITADEWDASIEKWKEAGGVLLHREVQEILCRAVCKWAGVPLAESEVEQRTREIAAMIAGAGSFGPRNWWGMLLRARTDRWMRGVIEQVRTGALVVTEGSVADVIARHLDPGGSPLDAEMAAAQLLDVLRPTVAVARFVTFAALALHEHPESRPRLQGGEDDDYTDLFVDEVRRFYPFIPVVAGRVLKEFEWRGYRFAEGTWVLLDLYGTNHDARIWDEPEAFRPERFRRWDGGAFNFIPQGGGDYYDDHRCAGEATTIALMKVAVRYLTKSINYDVPEQDFRISLSRIPALPKSGFQISNVRRAR